MRSLWSISDMRPSHYNNIVRPLWDVSDLRSVSQETTQFQIVGFFLQLPRSRPIQIVTSQLARSCPIQIVTFLITSCPIQNGRLCLTRIQPIQNTWCGVTTRNISMWCISHNSTLWIWWNDRKAIFEMPYYILTYLYDI